MRKVKATDVGLCNLAARLLGLPRQDVPFNHVEPAAPTVIAQDISAAERTQFFGIEPVVHRLWHQPFSLEPLENGLGLTAEPGTIKHRLDTESAPPDLAEQSFRHKMADLAA